MEVKYGFPIHSKYVSDASMVKLGMEVKLFLLAPNHVRVVRLDKTSGTPVRLLLPRFKGTSMLSRSRTAGEVSLLGHSNIARVAANYAWQTSPTGWYQQGRWC